MLTAKDIEETSNTAEIAHIYQFDDFRLDTSEETLYRNGVKVNINRRTFQVLRLLVERAGKIVTKQEFFDTVWVDTFVEDNSLTVAMTTLRKALGEDVKQAKFIENLPRKGYRFIADVKIVENAPIIPQIDVKIESAPVTIAENVASFKNRKILIGILSVCLLFLFAILSLNYFGFLHFSILPAKQTQIESLAVMPFENQDADTEYFSDGLTDSVINNLTGLSNLRVIDRNSVFLFKGKQTDLPKVGRELNVRAVLTGRFTKRGDNLIINVELTDLRDNKQIWGKQYNRQVIDALAVQQEISRDISEKLRAKLTGEEQNQLAKRETDNPEAYQLYLKGRYYWNKRTSENLEKGATFFQQAIDKDPTYALAYVGLGNCYLSGEFKSLFNSLKERVAMVQATEQKALEIDPELGEAHTTLAMVKFYDEWDWAGAEKEFKLAIQLNPNYATVHHWYGEFLATEGRFDESFAEYNHALELDPLSLAINSDLGFSYYYAHQIDRAIAHLKKLEASDPNFMRTHIFLSLIYEQKGMFEEANDENNLVFIIHGDDSQMLAERKLIFENAVKTLGSRGYWQQMMEYPLDRKNLNSMRQATIYLGLDERDKAFEFMEKGYGEGNPLLVWLKVSPEFDNIRSDPRFTDLIRHVGIP